MMKKYLFMFLIFAVPLSACSEEKTLVTEVAHFKGEGAYWEAVYTYDNNLYEDKKVGWVELKNKLKDQLSEDDLDQVHIELKSRDTTSKGNLGEMETRLNGNSVKFLVGTINFKTYYEDDFELTLTSEGDPTAVIQMKYLN